MVNIEEAKELLNELYCANIEYDGNVFKVLYWGEYHAIGFWTSELTTTEIDRAYELAQRQSETYVPEDKYDYNGWRGAIIIDNPLPINHPLLRYAAGTSVTIVALVTTPHNRRITLAEYEPRHEAWYFRSSSGHFVRYFLSLKG